MSGAPSLSPRWAALLGGLVVLFLSFHASTITTSRLPWFDDTFFASVADTLNRTGEFKRTAAPLWLDNQRGGTPEERARYHANDYGLQYLITAESDTSDVLRAYLQEVPLWSRSPPSPPRATERSPGSSRPSRNGLVSGRH